jgi:uncharacterized protein (DUF2236 family)
VSDAGLFGPETLTWRINRENVLLVGGGRALVLQVAHPLVAAGVAQHSNYRRDPFGRLQRTLDVTTSIVFGDPEECERASSQLWKRHSVVNGSTDEPGGSYPEGTPYDAHDPALLMWVHATLVDTSIMVYDRYVRRLTAHERSAYYEEQKLLGDKYGIPREAMPETYGDFVAYFDRMVADELAVTAALRDVVDSILDPDLPTAAKLAAKPLIAAMRLATIGLLPPSLRERLGYDWSPSRERMLSASRTAVRGMLPLMPAVAREFPAARRARKRLAT